MSGEINSLSIGNEPRRLLKNHDTLIQWVQHILNAMVVVGALFALAVWRDGVLNPHYRFTAVTAVLLMLIVYHYMGVHRRFENMLGGVQHLARAWGIVVVILAWVGFVTKTSEEHSRQVVLLWVVVAFFLQAGIFICTYWLHGLYQKRYREKLPALIIGVGSMAEHLAKSINQNIWLPDEIIGVVNYGGDPAAPWRLDGVPILGNAQDLERLIKQHNIRRVYIALPFSLTQLAQEVQSRLIDVNIDLIWAPDIFNFRLLNHSIREVAGVPLINLSETPLIAGGPAFVKLLMDKVIALTALILLSPLLIGTAIAVKLTSKGPVFFKQNRHGWDGRIIQVYKFRSMYLHDDQQGFIKQATKDDPRITPVGRFIRKTSIDELPQLLNVLGGSMSLVGPRPHAISHNDYYSDKVMAYLARHRIKPGMTGLAQVNGYRGETETIDAMRKRVEYDLEYIRNWSPLLDLKIILQTPFSLLSKQAY